ncbi:ribonuclease 1-like [Panicum miliaceum]|uniref:Ribonuclease 1-like n=1 Tax=Panicum miliaceum TaxID=4540 RepID=A0A3L6SKN6_PANMI|nr:ribonuclease 1-like [Panicum miliaceum]
MFDALVHYSSPSGNSTAIMTGADGRAIAAVLKQRAPWNTGTCWVGGGSFCDTQQGCCFPSTGKPPADFGIHGLWPNYAECRAAARVAAEAFDIVGVGARKKYCPEYCDDGNPLTLSVLEITDQEPASSEAQLFQVYQCVDRAGKEFVDCTLPMKSKCTELLGRRDFEGCEQLS